jgi:dTDP-4-amino-4,6-dideoxygalactose transaminase
MLNSCTAGLHVALVVHGIGPGNEVIVLSLTFAATANVVEHVGAKSILVDVLHDTPCIDPGAVQRALTPATNVLSNGRFPYRAGPARVPRLEARSEHATPSAGSTT